MTDTRCVGNIFIPHRSVESIKPEEQYFLLVSSHYRSSMTRAFCGAADSPG